PSRGMYYDGAYAPYGENYAEAGTTDRNFTGMNQDTVSSGSYPLYDFLMREHHPVWGRWLSPDPAGLAAANPSNPQSWNRYAYVLNNPLSSVDPSGRDCVWDNGSYDSADDPDTGGPGKCSDAGGTWIGHDVFANSQYYEGDWSGNPNQALSGLVGQIQACSEAAGGGQHIPLLVADAFASGFSDAQTAYLLATAAWESGPGGIGNHMT